ncbi:MAG: helix-turn-helix domain-containing protein [Patescibacteria group bacterium]
MDKKALRLSLLSLGLTDHESQVYVELVFLGTSTSGPLIKKTGLHRNVVYTSLEHLIEKKYVLESQIKGKKQFSVADPSVVVQEFEEKQRIATEIARAVSSLSVHPIQEITVYEGNEAYLNLLTEQIRKIPRGGASYILGTGGEEFMELTMRKIWDRYHKAIRTQGIHIKMISYESHREMLQRDLADQLDLYDIRYLPDDIENPSGVRIYPEAGVIVNMIFSTPTQPVTAIRIKNADLVQGQLNLFENLWKIGKP